VHNQSATTGFDCDKSGPGVIDPPRKFGLVNASRLAELLNPSSDFSVDWFD